MVVSLTARPPQKTAYRSAQEPAFYYFAYGSCMCPVDLKRSLGEDMHPYVVGPAALREHRLGFHYYSHQRQCSALDVLPAPGQVVHGVLYRLPWRLSPCLDRREEVHQGSYRREAVTVHSQGRTYHQVRTYSVVQKTPQEVAPNAWYAGVVLRGAIACRLPKAYCWQLFQHMQRLQTAAVAPGYKIR
jgi:cation transport regulator ChaC